MVIVIRATQKSGVSIAMHEMTQTKLGRTARRVSGTFLSRQLETKEGRMEGHLRPRNVYFGE